MPFEAVLLIAAFFTVGLVVIVRPVSEARLDRFSPLNSLALTDTGRAHLRAYLRRRRQQRTAGVLIAAAIGLMISIPENRVAFAYVPLLAGWLAGAVVAEYLARSGTPRAAQPTGLPYWWRSVP